MPAPREVELKLELGPLRSAGAQGARRRLQRLPFLRAGGETRRLVSTIFDTSDHALQRRGMVLRVRRDGDRRIQTIKAETGEGPLERSEWESEVAGDVPDLGAIPDASLRDKVAAAGPLAPVLETDFERTSWHVRHHGSDVEIALDRGAIRAGGREAPIGEIEIELKSGSRAAVFAVAREICEVLPARPGLKSKSERGYALLRAEDAPKAELFRVTRGMTAADAFQAIVRTCLQQYGSNEPGVFRGEAEALHKARVALRRLRSCLKLYKPLVTDPEGDRLRKGLRALSQDFGTARNLDVYLERLEGGEAAERASGLRAEREATYRKLTAKLRSKRVRLLFLDLLAYVETGDWLRDPERRDLRGRKVRLFAAETLEKRWRRLRKAGRDLAAQAPEARHEVRIRGKVLRYAAEFFAGAFPGREAQRRRQGLIRALTDLQTHLGDLNDIETGAAIGVGEDRLADPARETELLAAAQEAHGRIRRAEPFWA